MLGETGLLDGLDETLLLFFGESCVAGLGEAGGGLDESSLPPSLATTLGQFSSSMASSLAAFAGSSMLRRMNLPAFAAPLAASPAAGTMPQR